MNKQRPSEQTTTRPEPKKLNSASAHVYPANAHMSSTHTTTFESNMAEAGMRVLEGRLHCTLAALSRAATEADTVQREWRVAKALEVLHWASNWRKGYMIRVARRIGSSADLRAFMDDWSQVEEGYDSEDDREEEEGDDSEDDREEEEEEDGREETAMEAE
jgi:hypothetical protein